MASTTSYGPFDIVQRISVGGMAEVFQAVHRGSTEVVALKRILPNVAEDEEFIKLFHDEARVVRHLNHENIARIIDSGQVDASHYIAFEYVSGAPLRTIIDRAGAQDDVIPVDVVIEIVAQVCQGLEHAHGRTDERGQPLGIVHRDVSPQNVLVGFDGQVKLIDFGIAKAAGKITRTQNGSIKGTSGYMSPEQVEGDPIDRRADVFALGICLWEGLTLSRLFSGPNEVVVLEQIRTLTVAPPSELNGAVPAELDRIVLKALAKDRNQRYPTAAAFEADLRAFARTHAVAGGAARVAAFMGRLFPGEAARGAASRYGHQETNRMSDKGGSDLDVFDGLAKKSRPSVPPTSGPRRAPTPPPAPPAPMRQKTLLGMSAPNLPPPPPGAAASPGLPIPSRPTPPPTPRAPGAPPPPPPPSRAPSLPPMSRAAPPPVPSRPPPTRPVPSAPPPPPKKPQGPPLPSGPGGKAVPVDMDWDDEDEKTSVFEKGHEDAARALLRSAPPPAAGMPPPASHPTSAPSRLGAGAAALAGASGGAAPAMPPPSSHAASMPQPMHHPMPGPVSQPIPSYPSIPPAAPGAAKTIITVIAALLVIGLGAALFMLFVPREGTLIVTVAGPGNKPVDAVQVFVDGAKKCDSSPCRAAELGAGTHMVKVSAAGYQQTADQAVKVSGGEEAVINVTLARASEGTGIRVLAEGTGLKLSVDGKDIGPLPQELKDMNPGEHTIKIYGSDRYEPYEKKISVEPEKMIEVDPKLKVLKGLATIKEGRDAEGARVLLVSGGERRPLPRLPIKIDIPTDKPYRIVASRKGFSDFDQELLFEDGEAEKTFVIDMTVGSAAAEAPRAPAPGPRPPRAPRPGPAPAPKVAAAPAPGGAGTLNINSIPVSNVILDGRPLGTTPQVGMSVPAGAHTVVFVHPEHGRKVRTVSVQPGQTATAAVRFP